jgi:hypothetical protein
LESNPSKTGAKYMLKEIQNGRAAAGLQTEKGLNKLKTSTVSCKLN